MIDRLLTIPTNDIDLQRRGRTILSVALVLLGLVILASVAVIFRPDATPSLLGLLSAAVVIAASMALAHRGQVGLAAWVLVIMIIGAAMVPILIRREVTSSLLYLTLPVVVAGVVLRPWQVWLVLATGLLVVAYKALGNAAGPQSQPEPWVLLANSGMVMATLGVISFLSAKIVVHAFAEVSASRRAADAAAHQLEELNHSLEGRVAAQTSELRAAFEEVQAQANEKQALLDELTAQRAVIREMSVPVLPVSADTLVMPLVGDIDGERMVAIQSDALAAIERSHAHTLLIDLTGVAVVDTYVAQGLLRTVQAASLLGTRSVLIGIRPEVAQAIVGLGIDVGDVRTAANLASALSL
ncbi:STAS domain-containing protein [Chloroflexales bacterium ZM16-3]|nr:STAS domain-containing protein [Chloroflexales bacterium ZM16-3]